MVGDQEGDLHDLGALGLGGGHRDQLAVELGDQTEHGGVGAAAQPLGVGVADGAVDGEEAEPVRLVGDLVVQADQRRQVLGPHRTDRGHAAVREEDVDGPRERARGRLVGGFGRGGLHGH